MRDLKFRVWDGEGLISLSMAHTNGFVNIQHDDKDSQWANDLESTYQNVEIMQYTGFQDSKGNDIYDGDIVSIKNGGYADVIAQVVFDISAFWLYSEDIFLAYNDEADNMVRLSSIYMDTGEDGYLAQLEVIGNIYANPELIHNN